MVKEPKGLFMRFVVSHPTGNTFVRALLEELQKLDLLTRFYTTIGFGNGRVALFSKLKNKRFYDIPDTKIKRLWIPEIQRLIVKSDQESKRRLTDRSYKKLDAKTANELSDLSVDVIHAYEDGALKSFLKAKEVGTQCSYELPIVHWATSRRLLAEEAERYPEWEPTLETTREPEEKLFQKEEEMRLADRITCPSKFVLNSIPIEIRARKACQIAPFGSPRFQLSPATMIKRKNKLFKILFVGSMSQRKGLADLFEAMKIMKKEPVKLSILGQPSMPKEFYRNQFSGFEYYPPCSNLNVRAIMQQHDALVLPSIVEGRALVQQEALSCGLPIVVTPNAGGEDLIEDGITGKIVPIRSPEKIAEKVLCLLNGHLSNADTAKRCANKANAYSWVEYAQKIIEFNLIKPDQLLKIT